MTRVAIWVLGPPGSGKSFAIGKLRGWYVVSQDQELERILAEKGIPLDTRTYTEPLKMEFAKLRRLASDRTWDAVPDFRRSGLPIVYESTGDKPALLASEVALDRQAGYLPLGIGMRCTLDDCLRGNRNRQRILSDEVVRAGWQTFQQQIAKGTFNGVFGLGHFRLLDRNDGVDMESWVGSFF